MPILRDLRIMDNKNIGILVDSYANGIFSESNGSFPFDEDDQIGDLRQKFHNTVREKIIFLLFFLVLIVMSWMILDSFLRKKEKYTSTPATLPDDDESVVYRICFWICVFSLSISIGATLLLPISIVSNEVLLLYPRTYYVQWLNGMLIDGLWNLIFIFANLSLFILLPFAYFFIESEGFSGHKKGILAKFYEAVVVLALTGFAVWLGVYAIAAFFGSSEETGLLILNIFSSLQLPFIYSCISFFGVLLLLVCTPLGFTRLFSVLSQLLVGPQFLRNLDEEVLFIRLEVESLENKLKTKVECGQMIMEEVTGNGYLGMDEEDFVKKIQQMKSLVPREENDTNDEVAAVRNNIMKLSKELVTLEKLQQTPGWKRNLLYPLAFIFVFGLTAVAVLMVVLNTLQLLVGMKALPISARVEYELNQTISLGHASISILGSWGAALQVTLIFFFISTSLIGLYMIPGIRNCKPEFGNSPTSHIIYNCALVLILSSALPLLARILGITNFDLLGNYGRIEWLGNFWIVVIYNLVFCVTSILCLVTKFTSATRQEIVKRLKIVFRFRLPYINRKTPDFNFFQFQQHSQLNNLRNVGKDKKD